MGSFCPYEILLKHRTRKISTITCSKLNLDLLDTHIVIRVSSLVLNEPMKLFMTLLITCAWECIYSAYLDKQTIFHTSSSRHSFNICSSLRYLPFHYTYRYINSILLSYCAIYIRISYNSVTLDNCMPNMKIRHVDILVWTPVLTFCLYDLSVYFTGHIDVNACFCLVKHHIKNGGEMEI
jgi:hypothetical protein